MPLTIATSIVVTTAERSIIAGNQWSPKVWRSRGPALRPRATGAPMGWHPTEFSLTLHIPGIVGCPSPSLCPRSCWVAFALHYLCLSTPLPVPLPPKLVQIISGSLAKPSSTPVVSEFCHFRLFLRVAWPRRCGIYSIFPHPPVGLGWGQCRPQGAEPAEEASQPSWPQWGSEQWSVTAVGGTPQFWFPERGVKEWRWDW